MPVAEETETSSVPLSFVACAATVPVPDGFAVLFEEAGFSNGPTVSFCCNPGSGKTTTVKRLTLSLFEEASVSTGEATLSLPVLLVCRSIDWDMSDLATEILRRIGLDPDRLRHDPRARRHAHAAGCRRSTRPSVMSALGRLGWTRSRTKSPRSSLLNQLERLRRMIDTTRIVCSCRSGDAPHLEGFATAELLPLSEDQITSIVLAPWKLSEAFFAQRFVRRNQRGSARSSAVLESVAYRLRHHWITSGTGRFTSRASSSVCCSTTGMSSGESSAGRSTASSMVRPRRSFWRRLPSVSPSTVGRRSAKTSSS